MALKATIFKANLEIADMNRNYYHKHHLVVARHPSENDLRMMVRVVVFAANASEDLEFTKGLSREDEPDLWLKNPGGEIKRWIELGQPDVKRIRKASGRAHRVQIYCYNLRSASVWWQQNSEKMQRFDKLDVTLLKTKSVDSLNELANKNMQLHISIQDNQIWISDDCYSIQLESEHWK